MDRCGLTHEGQCTGTTGKSDSKRCARILEQLAVVNTYHRAASTRKAKEFNRTIIIIDHNQSSGTNWRTSKQFKLVIGLIVLS